VTVLDVLFALSHARRRWSSRSDEDTGHDRADEQAASASGPSSLPMMIVRARSSDGTIISLIAALVSRSTAVE